MKTYRCIKEFWVDDYTFINKLSLWNGVESPLHMLLVEIKDKNRKEILISLNNLEEYFEEIK